MTAGRGGQQRRTERLLLSLIRFYPPNFRSRFEESLRYSIVRDLRRIREAGRWRALMFWLATALSLVVNGLVERATARSTRDDPAPDPLLGRKRLDGGRWPAESVVREIRFAARRLTRHPGYAFTATLTLALGIGATTAVFSVVERVLLRPPPYPQPERLVRVAHRSPAALLGMPNGAYLYYADHAASFESIAAYVEASSTIAGTGEPLELGIVEGTMSLLPTLGVEPLIGRGFTEADFDAGAQPVAVVSHGFWVRHLGADDTMLGEEVLEGSGVRVVGVLPRDFEFLRPRATVVFGNRFGSPDLYVPLQLDPSEARFGNFMYQSIGRLAPGISAVQATEELDRLMVRAAEYYPHPGGLTPAAIREGGYRAVVAPLRDALVGDIAGVLWILLGAVGALFLIAVVNVANLFLVRAESRRGEIAVHRALGAGAGPVASSFMFEAGLLAVIGGVLGILLAQVATEVVIPLVPAQVPGLEDVGLGFKSIAFTLGTGIVAALSCGIAASMRMRGLTLAGELTSAGRGGPVGRSRGRESLVILQLALATLLLIGSGLLLRTFQNIQDVDPGFDPTHVLTLRLSLGGPVVRAAGYEQGPVDARRSRLMMDLVDRLQSLPGVESAAFSADLPLDGQEFHDFVAVEGRLPESLADGTRALRVFVGANYLRTIGAKLVAGRELQGSDFADQPRSVVVNRSFAEQRWGTGDPIGRRLLQYWPGVDPDADVWYTVVGVVEDIRESTLLSEPEPTVYLPTVFLPEGGFGVPVSNMVLVVRTVAPPEAMKGEVRAAIRQFHSEIPVNSVATLEEVTSRSFGRITFAMVLLVITGFLSSLLAVIGIYGTVAYVVSRKTREFGLRLALGATGGDVRSMVIGRGARVAGIGIGVGVAGALLGGRVIESLLFDVQAADLGVTVGVVGVLLAAVLVASLVPAYRAGAVDPLDAMRAE